MVFLTFHLRWMGIWGRVGKFVNLYVFMMDLYSDLLMFIIFIPLLRFCGSRIRF